MNVDIRVRREKELSDLEGCQIPCLPRISEGQILFEQQSLTKRIKRLLAKPWNYQVKPWLKATVRRWEKRSSKAQQPSAYSAQAHTKNRTPLKAGDVVRVRSAEEIQSTLDRFKELKGCAFLEYMWQYCGTTQRVLKPVERFLDERDYKVKKARGIVLLENVICQGTPVFGRCDRACHLFWREEWLEKIDK
jgi:hypothetical protein